MQSCDYGPHLVHLFISTMKLDFLFFQYFRKSSSSKTVQNGTQPLSRTNASIASGHEVGKNLEEAVESEDSLMPMMMPNSFIDTKVLQATKLICCIILPSIHLPYMCKIYLEKKVKCIISISYLMKCETVLLKSFLT